MEVEFDACGKIHIECDDKGKIVKLGGSCKVKDLKLQMQKLKHVLGKTGAQKIQGE